MTASANQPSSDVDESGSRETVSELSDVSSLREIDFGLSEQLKEAQGANKQAETQAEKMERGEYLTTSQEVFISQPFLSITKILFLSLFLINFTLYPLIMQLQKVVVDDNKTIVDDLVNRAFIISGFIVIPLLALLLGYYLGLSSRRLIK